MRRSLRHLISSLALALAIATPARADDRSDCRDHTAPPDVAIAACTRAMMVRANVPERIDLLIARGAAYRLQGDLDRAIADFSAALTVDPRRIGAYEMRGNAYFAKREHDRAIADFTQALRLNPRFPPALISRANANFAKNNVDAALADYGQALALNPRNPGAYAGRGNVWRRKGDVEKAIADYSEAIRLAPNHLGARLSRGLALEAKGERDAARADYEVVLAVAPAGEGVTRLQETARARIAMLGSPERSQAPAAMPARPIAMPAASAAPAAMPAAPTAMPATPTASAPVRGPQQQVAVATPSPPPKKSAAAAPAPAAANLRLALVIGNGAYVAATPLGNPPNDAVAVAKALRDVGFEVIEGENLDRSGMERLVRDFLRRAATARLALLYYAGHGMQVDGRNYLIPVDAKLAAPSDLPFETIELDKIVAGLDDEARANVIVLDACRDNPLTRSFASKLGATRSTAVSAGLAGYDVVGTGTLIAFATAPGQTALDGAGANSPFTTAFIKHVSTRGIEVNQMLTRVRREVAAATNNKQVPWANSSLMGDVFLAGQ